MPCRCKQRAPSHHRVWPPISKSRGRCLRLRRFFPRYKRGGDALPMQAEGAESSSGLPSDLQVSREMSSVFPRYKRGGDALPIQVEGAESSSGLAADLQVFSRAMSSAPPVFSSLPARSAVAGAACQRSGKHRMYVLVVCTSRFVSWGALWLARLSKGVRHC